MFFFLTFKMEQASPGKRSARVIPVCRQHLLHPARENTNWERMECRGKQNQEK